MNRNRIVNILNDLLMDEAQKCPTCNRPLTDIDRSDKRYELFNKGTWLICKTCDTLSLKDKRDKEVDNGR